MPSLSTQQIQQLQQQLQEQRTQLEETIRRELRQSDQELAARLAEQVHDNEELSFADLVVDLNLTVIDHQVQELREVENAFLRMEQGTYGVCTECNDAIEFERLHANPAAKRCFTCQTIHEQSHQQEPYPTL